jgi:hypothetical protein
MLTEFLDGVFLSEFLWRRAEMIDPELGVAITPKVLAERLSVSVQTVRRYYYRWGGVEVAPGTIRFFENKIREILNADVGQKASEAPLAGSCQCSRHSTGEAIPRRNRGKSSRRNQVGGACKEDSASLEASNRHGLADIDNF